IADMLRHHEASELPDVLTEYVQGRTHYDYRDHTDPNADHADYVPDEIVDRFTVIGTPEECVEHLRELADAGVTEFNIYARVQVRAKLVREVAQEIIPVMAGAVANSRGGRDE